MRKFQTLDADERLANKKASSAARMILLVMVVLISPLVYEVGNVAYGRWQSVTLRSHRIETPIMDAIARYGSEFRGEFGGMGTSVFRKIEWKPTTIVPLAFGFAAIAAWFLRRGI